MSDTPKQATRPESSRLMPTDAIEANAKREERERIVQVVENAEGQPLGDDMPETFLLGFETGFLACQEAILAAIAGEGEK